jgi:hypothetical protein
LLRISANVFENVLTPDQLIDIFHARFIRHKNRE